MKINYDHYDFDKKINNALLYFIMKYGSEEDKEDILNKEKEEEIEQVGIVQLKLKPDSPDFIPSPMNIKKSRLKNIQKLKMKNEEELEEDKSLHFFDIFDIVKMKCMKQFGLPEISINDLIFNNVKKGFLVVNGKGKLINIITNKGANSQFIQNLINLSLENNISQLNNNLNPAPLSKVYNNPFKPKKPSPFN